MILKIDGFYNYFQLTDTSCTADLNWIREQYEPEGIHCIICSNETARHFKFGLFAPNVLTINNKVPYGYFYLNKKW